ncbi:MAG: Mut7-C RNAse domain-containing protein, partial [Candidatus Omnitrophica bacterium]|nr:Mut7-C RNAse domain-containing protein [Candidatus Omnitrophota bacterium]
YYTKDTLGTQIIQALCDERVIVTRKKDKIDALGKNTFVIHSEVLREQLKEFFKHYALEITQEKMFSRCTLCNEVLQAVPKEEVKNKVPPYVFAHQDFFMQCPACKKIYWRGSHWGNVKEVFSQQLSAISKNIIKAED